jgi:quinoprotein glucose dehydrogenase
MFLKPPRLVLVITVALALTSFSAAQQGRTRPGTGYLDWKAYGGGPDNIRYSRLDQINRNNVRKLKVAWTFDSGDAFPGSEMQCNPIMVNGALFVTTPKHRILALDAARGTLRWSFDPTVGKKMTYRTRIRGFNYWENGEDQRRPGP